MLDFGCGSGKVMRHFLSEAEVCELWGCDIDTRSVDWINAELSPPLHAFANGEAPPLDQPAESFDLVWSVSVFTHLADHWAGWLAELHRVLRPGGLAIVSFLGGAMYEVWTGESWEPDRIGMTVLDHGQDWELGGPTVFHSRRLSRWMHLDLPSKVRGMGRPVTHVEGERAPTEPLPMSV